MITIDMGNQKGIEGRIVTAIIRDGIEERMQPQDAGIPMHDLHRESVGRRSTARLQLEVRHGSRHARLPLYRAGQHSCLLYLRHLVRPLLRPRPALLHHWSAVQIRHPAPAPKTKRSELAVSDWRLGRRKGKPRRRWKRQSCERRASPPLMEPLPVSYTCNGHLRMEEAPMDSIYASLPIPSPQPPFRPSLAMHRQRSV